MTGDRLDGAALREMFLSAANMLEANKANLNALNVFPVPDGDTGTNMTLTMMAVVKELKSNQDNSLPAVALAAARGALKGARGNSGVILSQIFRGMSQAFSNAEEITPATFASAMRSGADTAYKSVMKPKEGTILTVARTMADEAYNITRSSIDIYTFFDHIIAVGEIAVKRTPDQLPVLKKAGVVDAGGKGLLAIYQAFKAVINGEVVTDTTEMTFKEEESKPALVPAAEGDEEDINFAYCTEFFVKHILDYVNPDFVDRFRDRLSKIGDSLVVVGDSELIKVHVHTNSPGKALQYALQLGELDSIKIENMLEQHRLLRGEADQAEPPKDYGIVSVVAGDGLAGIFRELMVDEIIQGGQTMNPSTEDILRAVEKVNAKSVFILPNNSNIILAAQLVKDLTTKNIFVIPTKSVPQGIAAVIAFNPEAGAEDNAQAMEAAIGAVKTGQVTFAVRDTSIDDKEIRKNDLIGIYDGRIHVVGTEPQQTAIDLVSAMTEPTDSIITAFYGADITKEQAQLFKEKLLEKFADCEVEVHYGGQPLYYYIISIE